MENINYVVTFHYSYDDDKSAYLFENFEDAWKFLQDDLKEEYRIQTEENGFEAVLTEYPGRNIIEIKTRFFDHDDVTTGYVIPVYE